jgi:hypothetical protein
MLSHVEAELAEFASDADAAWAACDERSNADEHPGWHHYDMAASDLRGVVKDAEAHLYALGWITVEKKGVGYWEARGEGGRLENASTLLDEIETTTGRKIASRKADDDAFQRARRKVARMATCDLQPNQARRNAAETVAWNECVEALLRDGFGWVTQEGRVITCPLHAHMTAVRDLGEIEGEFQQLDEAQDLLRKAKAAWKRAGYPQSGFELEHRGHADALVTARRREIVQELYRQGWIRLGRNEEGSTVDAEGEPETVGSRMELLRSLARDVDGKLEIHGPGRVTATPVGRPGRFRP